MRGIFVTGTGTGVGKTIAAAALMHRYRGDASVASPLRYWKPIQTGIEQDDDTATVRGLGCSESEIFDRGIRLREPVSPHLAAERAGERIDLGSLRALVPEIGATWIVEGAGGVLVPVNESETMADWIELLQLPVLVVARSELGTINHTLLTLEALRTRRLTVGGVLMIGEPDKHNRAAIEHYGDVAVVGEMPVIAPLNADSLAQWSREHLDPAGLLLEFLR